MKKKQKENIFKEPFPHPVGIHRRALSSFLIKHGQTKKNTEMRNGRNLE
jgi:hypothetical protein